MSHFGPDYTRTKFCEYGRVKEDSILQEKIVGYMETIYYLRDGRRFLYDEMSNNIYLLKEHYDEVPDHIWKREFGRRLVKMMRLKGLSGQDIARTIGVNAVTISRYCAGHAMPNIRILQKICGVLNCSIDFLSNFDYLK